MKQKNRHVNNLARSVPWRSAFFWTWLAISVILIIPAYLSIQFKQNWPTPINAIRSLIRGEPQSSITFFAKRSIHIFTVLTQDEIEVRPASYSNLSTEQKLLGRITLREYKTGDELSPNKLGPQLTAGVNYQVQEITVPDSLSWLIPGDTASFVLIDTSCPSSTRIPTSATPAPSSTTSTCLPTQATGTKFPNLLDAVILENGTVEKDGLISFLVAIPTDENQAVLSLLDKDTGNIVAYLLVNVSSGATPTPTP